MAAQVDKTHKNPFVKFKQSIKTHFQMLNNSVHEHFALRTTNLGSSQMLTDHEKLHIRKEQSLHPDSKKSTKVIPATYSKIINLLKELQKA
jgi:hypothetical protein